MNWHALKWAWESKHVAISENNPYIKELQILKKEAPDLLEAFDQENKSLIKPDL